MNSSGQQNSKSSLALVLLTCLLFVVVLCFIWIPELAHYYVPLPKITSEAVERSRSVPPAQMLQELASHRLLERKWQNDAELIGSAEKLLKGFVRIPNIPPLEIHLPFDSADLQRGTGLWQLQFSGLIVPEIFIDAYRKTGKEEFYEMARDVILAWAKYERSAWLNHGFLWNDHAVAARIRTLADFWSIYRTRPDYQPEAARRILEFAARTASLLAKPDQYTVATNHGVMQNIGLWQYCIAFPALPATLEYKQTAFSRLKEEIAFYVAPDGVVLEHSAGYHDFGVFLFGLVLRYATLLNVDIPSEWSSKYEQAQKFSSELRRPDNSLPPFGDTAFGPRFRAALETQKDEHGKFAPLAAPARTLTGNAFALYPVSGYAILWDDLNRGEKKRAPDPAQTVLAGSFFPGHGHKHADEPSVLLWAKGQEWWSNVGYWPYDDVDRRSAECWEGSNAPHLVDEQCASDRTTELTASLNSNNIQAVEGKRKGPGNLEIRRLLVRVPPFLWLVVDDCANQAGNLRTTWTVSPAIHLKQLAAPNAYVLSSSDGDSHLLAYFAGPRGMKVASFHGNHDPFAGWGVSEGRPIAASAVVTEHPCDGGWAVTIWLLGGPQNSNSGIAVDRRGRESWKIQVPAGSGSQVVAREGAALSLDDDSSVRHSRITGTLESLPSVHPQVAALRDSFSLAASHSPRFRDLSAYRLRATLAVIFLLLLQEILLAIYRRRSGRYLGALRVLALLGWIAICIWVPVFYLRTS